MASNLPNLTVQQLDYLVAVVESPTWADAASRLGVSPSALSQGVAELERHVGVQLFERQGRRRVLAASAAPVLEHARDVLARTRDLADWSARTHAGRAGDLRVGMIDARGGAPLPGRAPALSSPASRGRAAAHRGAVGLLAGGPRTPARSTLLYASSRRRTSTTSPCSASGPTSSPSTPVGLAGRPSTWGPWVTFPAGSHTRQLIDSALRRRSAPFDVVTESHQPEVLREMVALGFGWTVLPTVQAGRLRPVCPLTKRSLVLARRSAAAPNAAADILAAQLRTTTSRPPR